MHVMHLAIDAAYGLLMGLAGALLAWLYWSVAARAAIRKGQAESAEAQRALVRLQHLTQRMAADVDQHSDAVQRISEDLQARTDPDPELILAQVTRIVDANREMQERLSESEKRLEEQAQLIESQAAEVRTDPLTRVLNRRGLEEELDRRSAEVNRHGTPLSVIMLDLDHFKRLNDHWGHQAGDEVLRGVGGVLLETMRLIDVVGRYGGEEFAVVLPHTSVENAVVAAERARRAIEQQRFTFSGEGLTATASLGVAQLCPGEQPWSLICRADEALYAAKAAGRNNTHWHDGREVRPTSACAERDDSALGKRDSQRPEAQPEDAPPESKTVSPPGRKSRGAQPSPGNEPRTPQHAELLAVPAGFANRTEFCRAVQRRLAEWKRGGPGFSVVLVSVSRRKQSVLDDEESEKEPLPPILVPAVTAVLREMDFAAEFRPGCLGVLVPGAKESEAADVARRLREAIAACLPSDPPEFEAVTTAAGLAHVAQGDDMVRLLTRAEMALQRACKPDHAGCSWHNEWWAEPVAPLESSA